MARKQKKRRKKRSKTSEFSAQTGILIDRLTAQDPNGETLGHFIGSLKETLTSNPELATAFVEELGKLKLEIAGRVFREIEGLFDEKKYRKAVKRTRFKLLQKGILKEEDEKKEDHPAVRYLVTSADRPLSLSYFAMIEPIGEQLVMVYIPGRADRDTIIEFVIDQKRMLGLPLFKKSYYKRSLIKDLKGYLEAAYETIFFEIPISYAAYLFNEGLAAGVVEVQANIKEAERELKKYLEADTIPLIYKYVNENEIIPSREALARAAGLLGDESFPLKMTPLGEDILWADKFRGVFESTLIVNPATRQQQMEDIISESIEEYFSEQTLHGFIRCLEEHALYCYLKDEKEKCFDLLAVAKDLKDNREKISSNSFLKKLFKCSAAMVLEDVLTDEDFEFYFGDCFEEIQDDDDEGFIIVP